MSLAVVYPSNCASVRYRVMIVWQIDKIFLSIDVQQEKDVESWMNLLLFTYLIIIKSEQVRGTNVEYKKEFKETILYIKN